MSTVASLPLRRPVLADLAGRTAVRSATLVGAAVLVTALAAQIRIPIPWSPVPITGTTFAVLLTAAALGPGRGALAQAVYVAVGLAGIPVFTGWESGVAHLAGATGGYLVGFVAAAWVVGACARRGLDRSPHGTVGAFVLGSLVIYAFGGAWLAVGLGLGPSAALAAGVVPFLVGDALKAALAAGLLPIAWRLTGRS